MATHGKTTDDSIDPTGFLIAFLIAAMAIGSAVNGDGIDLPREGGTAAFKDPCHDKERDHVVESFQFGRYTLRCGHRDRYGWRHIRKRHAVSHKMADCIDLVLDNAPLKRHEGKLRAEWAFRPGDYARVVINPHTNNLVTAYTMGDGKELSSRWDDCVRGAAR